MRPKPRITKRKNLYNFYLAKAKEFAKEISSYRGVLGIVLSGGVSRGYADPDSELDLTIFLTPKAYDLWVNKLQAPVSASDTFHKGIYSSFVFENIEEFEKKELSHFTQWDLSYAKILYDPSKQIAKLLKEKVSKPPLSDKELAKSFTERDSWTKVWWFPAVAEGWLKRGDILQAHVILNSAIQGVIDSLYLLNREYIAYDKWAAHFARSLPWLPKNFIKNFKQALLVKKLSAKEVLRRSKAIRRLFEEMNVVYNNLPFTPTDEKKILLWAFRKKKFTLKDYQKKFPKNLNTVLEDPLAKITNRQIAGKDVTVEIDFSKVKRILKSKRELTPWSYNTLREAYKQINPGWR